MRKQQLFYCMLVFILLLLTPSISAKQQSMNNPDIRETMSLNENVKFSNLYKFISFCLFNRFYRGLCLEMISAVYDQETQEQIILKPIIYNRAKWLLISAAELNEYFQKLSDKFGWNWEMPI